MQYRLSLIPLSVVCFVAAATTVLGITVADPTFAPAEGSSATSLNVVVSCATPGATIRYTLNGVDPTPYDTIIASGTSVTIQRTQELRAKAWVGTDSSATVIEGFEITGEVAAGTQHSLSLKSFRAVHGWGTQLYGRLANGSTSVTVDVTSPGIFNYSSGNPVTNALAIAAGYNHNVIVEGGAPYGNGNVWTVGYGAFGELGNNASANSTYPVKVFKTGSPSTPPVAGNYLTGCLAVAAGQYFSGALGSDQKVYTWGHQQFGRLGNGATSLTRQYAAPVKKIDAGNPDLTGIAEIEFGDTQAMAREETSDPANTGYVWSWGSNANLQLGHGTSTASQPWAKRMVLDASGTVLKYATNISTGANHSAIVRWKAGDSTLQGSVWTVGNQQYGRLGNGVTTNTNIGYPARVKTGASTYLGDIVQVSCGSAHTLARDSSGRVWAWGYNTKGALGNDTTTTTNNEYAGKVKGPSGGGSNVDGSGFLTNVVWISAGGVTTNSFSLAVTKDGKIYGWGANESGQLGIGTSSTSAYKLPVEVGSFNLHPVFPTSTVSHSLTHTFYPGSATLTAVPTDTDGSISKVEFFRNGVLESTKTSPPWTLSLTAMAAGTYYYAVRVTDNGGNIGWSSSSSFVIDPDSDGDGLPDPWEITWFGSLAQGAGGDPDFDGLTTLVEYGLGFNPNTPPGSLDTDSDQLPDDWETANYTSITAQNGGGDYDGDGLTNKWEFDHGTSTKTTVGNRDSDGDNLPDDWERYYFSGSLAQIKFGDTDADSLSNFWEYSHLTNPTSTVGDSEPDGLPDDWEVYYFGNIAQTKTGDPDSDGLTNDWERIHDTVPNFTNGSADGDALPDVWEVAYYSSAALYGNDSDPDSDRVKNLLEFQKLTDPMNGVDGDLDGLPDDWERYYFNGLTQTAVDDFDSDGMSNLREFLLGAFGTPPNTLPGLTNADGDALPDDWERYYGILADTGFSDSDGDGVSNLNEFNLEFDPTSSVDIDSDGMSDDWELYYFLDLGQDETSDYDGDRVSDLNEFSQRTYPDSAYDSEPDGLADDWERFHFGDLTKVGTEDTDGDGLSNLWEFTHNTNPNTLAEELDSDEDGLPDDWEILYFASLTHGPEDDSDYDRLTNAQELLMESANPNAMPWDEDADEDDMPDDWEVFYFSNLSEPDDWDYDADGVTNLEEFILGTDPTSNLDSDLDGIPDDLELLYFGNLGSSTLPVLDSDGDGVSDADEIIAGTDPHDADSDNDGIPDDIDPYPNTPATVALGAATTIHVWSPVE